MPFDLRVLAILLMFVGVVVYALMRYYRRGDTLPPSWERALWVPLFLIWVIALALELIDR